MSYRNYVSKVASTVGGAVVGLAALVSAGCGSMNSPPKTTLQSGEYVYSNGRVDDESERIVSTVDKDGNLCGYEFNGRNFNLRIPTDPYSDKAAVEYNGVREELEGKVDELEADFSDGTKVSYDIKDGKSSFRAVIKGDTVTYDFASIGDVSRGIVSIRTEYENVGSVMLDMWGFDTSGAKGNKITLTDTPTHYDGSHQGDDDGHHGHHGGLEGKIIRNASMQLGRAMDDPMTSNQDESTDIRFYTLMTDNSGNLMDVRENLETPIDNPEHHVFDYNEVNGGRLLFAVTGEGLNDNSLKMFSANGADNRNYEAGQKHVLLVSDGMIGASVFDVTSENADVTVSEVVRILANDQDDVQNWTDGTDNWMNDDHSGYENH